MPAVSSLRFGPELVSGSSIRTATFECSHNFLLASSLLLNHPGVAFAERVTIFGSSPLKNTPKWSALRDAIAIARGPYSDEAGYRRPHSIAESGNGLREYTRLLYEHAAREQREPAQRVRAALMVGGALAFDFERRAAEFETELARRNSDLSTAVRREDRAKQQRARQQRGEARLARRQRSEPQLGRPQRGSPHDT